MADDWDLHALVRSCTAASTTTASSAPPSTFASAASAASTGADLVENSFSSLPPFLSSSNPVVEELHELYKPFFPKTHPLPPTPPPPPPPLSLSSQSSPISSSLTSFSLSKDPIQSPTQHKQSHVPPPLITTATNGSNGTASANSQPSRSKRRKNQQKRVCHVPADAISSDEWAWRKYGQKPIKGSPYPRGYYRCSSSKGCLARKQVERNRSDPTMFIVTYTGEHNHPAPTHRNSLAGSTRQKPLHPQSDATSAAEPDKATSQQQPSCSSPANSVSLDEDPAPQSTKTESMDDLVDDEEDEPVLSDMAMSDDFFEGLEDFDAAAATGDSFADRFPANFGINWAANSTATAAGGT